MEIQIPFVFFYLIGVAAVIAAAGWAIPKILKAWGEMPPSPLDKITEGMFRENSE